MLVVDLVRQEPEVFGQEFERAELVGHPDVFRFDRRIPDPEQLGQDLLRRQIELRMLLRGAGVDRRFDVSICQQAC